jgi:excinuclease UvrABC nuclease subunit
MVSQELKAKLRDVPHQPGVYIMKDRLGSIIYVGKAIDLNAGSPHTSSPLEKTAPA